MSRQLVAASAGERSHDEVQADPSEVDARKDFVVVAHLARYLEKVLVDREEADEAGEVEVLRFRLVDVAKERVDRGEGALVGSAHEKGRGNDREEEDDGASKGDPTCDGPVGGDSTPRRHREKRHGCGGRERGGPHGGVESKHERNKREHEEDKSAF